MENNRQNKEIYYETLMNMVDDHNSENYYTDILPFMLGLGIPTVEYDGLFTQPNETIVYVVNGVTFEDKVEFVGNSGGYSGVNVRIAKGLTVHTGGGKGQPIKDVIRDEDYGDYVVTNKRIVFISDYNSFEIPLDKITAITDDGFSELYIHTSRKTRNVKFETNTFKYALLLTRIAIDTFQQGVDVVIDTDKYLEQISYKDYSVINRFVSEYLSKQTKDGSINPLNNIDFKTLNEIYKFLINNSIEIGLEYKLVHETTFKDLIFNLFYILNRLRLMGHIHFYDENKKEILTDNEFLERYEFLEKINFEKNVLPYIKKDLMIIFSIISFLRNTKNTTKTLNLIKDNKLNINSPFDNFLNKDKNKWVDHSKDIESYIVTSLQHYIKNYNNYNLNKSYGKSIYKEVKISNDNYKYIPYENKSKIDFKNKCSYEEFGKELTAFYTIFDLKPDIEIAIEQYLFLHLKYLYNFVKTHRELRSRYKQVKDRVLNKNIVYDFLKDNIPEDWVILKNVAINNLYYEIVIINKSGVFNFDLNSFDFKSNNSNENRAKSDDAIKYMDEKNFKNIVLKSISKTRNLVDCLKINYPKEGFLFRKKPNLNWDEIVNGAIFIDNNKINISNEFGYPILNPKYTRTYFENHSKVILSDKQIKKIESILKFYCNESETEEYPIHCIMGYDKEYLSELDNSSGVFFSNYLINLGGSEFEINEFMNLGQALTYCPIRRNVKNKVILDFVKVKECEYFIKKFFEETTLEDLGKLRKELLKFTVDILKLDQKIL